MKPIQIIFSCFLLLVVAGCSTNRTPEIRLDKAAVSLNTDINRRSISNFVIQKDGTPVYAWVSNDLVEGDDLKFQSWGHMTVMASNGTVVQVQDGFANALVDPESPPQLATSPDGTLYLAWSASDDLESVWRSSGIRVSSSKDGGLTWSDPVTASGAFGGYQNNHELHVGADGSVWVAWLDSRLATQNEGGINVFVARSDDGGLTYSNPAVVDEHPSCECCRVSIVTDSEGTAYVAWRKRLDGGIRDIVVAKSTDNGATWSEPNTIYEDNWVQGYCPDAGPSILLGGKGRMHIAWWTGIEGASGVKTVYSDDGGRSFSAPNVLSTSEISRASHVQLAFDGNATLAVVWDDGSLETPRIAVSASSNNGQSFSATVYVSPDGMQAAYPHASFTSSSELSVVWNVRGDAEHQTSTEEVSGTAWMVVSDNLQGPRIIAQQISLD